MTPYHFLLEHHWNDVSFVQHKSKKQNMKRITISSLIKKSLMCSTLLFSSMGMTQTNLDAVLDKYNPSVQEGNFGMTFLLKKSGQIETASIGNHNLNKNSVFNIGSNTKTMTAVLVLQEQERGSLSIQDSIGKYLNPINNVDGSLTIESLLRHRSGLGEMCGKYVMDYFKCTSDTAYRTNFLEQIPAGDSTKHGVFEYCNTNYVLLGHILEKVTDRYYFDLLRERIFEPCGMNNSYPYLHKNIKNLAPLTMHGEDVSTSINHKFYAEYAFSAGSVASSLSDMMKFYEHLYLKNTLLQPASFQLITDFGDGEYGMGMFETIINGTKYIGHGGDNVGSVFRNYFNPETKDFVLMFGNAYIVPVKSLVTSELDDYLNGRELHKQFDSNPAKLFKKYVGKYTLEELGEEMEIMKKDNSMYLVVQGMELELKSINGTKLVYLKYGIMLEPSDNKKDMIYSQSGMTLPLIKNK